jgi:hypothetical protein
MDTTTQKDKLARFGRSVALMLNRSLMYQKSHPMVQDSIKEVVTIADVLFFALSPIVFILNRGQFYVDEEPLDPRINVKRIATIFKNHGIQSVSFENGLTTSELDIFIDIYSSMDMSADAEEIKKSLFSRGVYNIKVNHVLYKKVTEDDQVVSRDALKNVTPTMESEDSQSRKKFMDTLLESILTEEFANTLNIKSLLANPSMVSKNMVQADMASAQKMGASPGPGGGVGGGSGAGPGPGGGGGTGGIGTGPGPGGGGGAGGGSGAGPGPGGGGGAGGSGAAQVRAAAVVPAAASVRAQVRAVAVVPAAAQVQAQVRAVAVGPAAAQVRAQVRAVAVVPAAAQVRAQVRAVAVVPAAASLRA